MPFTPTDWHCSYPRDLWQGSDKCRSITSTHWQSYWQRFPCSPWGQSRQGWKSGGIEEMFPPFSDKWVAWHRLQVTVQNGCLWAESTVRRKRGAWTKSDRCTGKMKIQKLFAFVVIKHTHAHTHAQILFCKAACMTGSWLFQRQFWWWGDPALSKSISKPRNW